MLFGAASLGGWRDLLSKRESSHKHASDTCHAKLRHGTFCLLNNSGLSLGSKFRKSFPGNMLQLSTYGQGSDFFNTPPGFASRVYKALGSTPVKANEPQIARMNADKRRSEPIPLWRHFLS